MSTAERANGLLTIDLGRIAENFTRLRERFGGSTLAAVVKADGYGLGLSEVVPALLRAGARVFFTATLDEAIDAAECTRGSDTTVAVLNGLARGAEGDYPAHGLQPVLNSLEELGRWQSFCRDTGRVLPAMLHLDTGMSRLGLGPDERAVLAAEPWRLNGVEIRTVMSHLACAEEPEHSLNAEQLAEFREAIQRFPGTAVSFVNSSGIFLEDEYHFDLGRPGVALYGGNPTPGRVNPMRQVVRLQGKILQVREIDRARPVGYGATHRAPGRRRIATVALGYADGYLRALSNRGTAWVANTEVPVVGRVSMDLITLDVTHAPSAVPGGTADIFGPDGVNRLAEEAGTIAYEILTGLGRRYHRTYVG